MKQTKLRIARETRLEVYTKQGVWVPPSSMLEQIARGNFDARRQDVRITVVGTMQSNGDRSTIEIDQPGSPSVSLTLVPGKELRPEEMPALRQRTGERVELTGIWRPGAGEGPARLLVSQWKPATGSAPAHKR